MVVVLTAKHAFVSAFYFFLIILMLTQHFSITINAPVAKVRDTMLADAAYRQRTAAFNPAWSRYEGNRAEGTKIVFLGPDPSNPDNIGGMVSRIARNTLHKIIDIEHLGEVSNGVEDTPAKKSKHDKVHTRSMNLIKKMIWPPSRWRSKFTNDQDLRISWLRHGPRHWRVWNNCVSKSLFIN